MSPKEAGRPLRRHGPGALCSEYDGPHTRADVWPARPGQGGEPLGPVLGLDQLVLHTSCKSEPHAHILPALLSEVRQGS